ncbi:hypothetical protein [Hymenobacter sp. PAMC 26628]|uniref:hypothetical protein n=1 Tax=Hymenobacter sp. PAMC 26628 TaxID=1484118 RepID=UPI0007706307|nr:hypothetical protein [Hymenobacter sp. PAMC 26628]AMJ67333.1 hypothetical protein AXW84_19345 [Hymenobacter sp. PAMC 26628]
MRAELEHLRCIEQHLLGGPGPARPAPGPALEADAEAQRQAYGALYMAGQRQLRRELAAIHQTLYSPRVGRWAWTAAAAGLRLVFARWGRRTQS